MVDEDALRLDLLARGVVDHHLSWAVDQIKGLGRLQDTLVLWPGNLVEQAIAVLTVSGVPKSHEQIARHIGRDINIKGLRDRLFQDSRVIRVTKDDFALASWGMPEYGGVVASMVTRIEEVGPCVLRELADHLAERHAIKPGSVTAYSAAPIFVLEDGVLRLRRPDEPYVPSLRPAAVRGLFALDGASRIALHVRVDKEILRGSGRPFPVEVASALGVAPGQSAVMSNTVRDLPINWSASSHMGPNIGSLRAHAEAVGATDGDELRLVFDRTTHSLDCTLFDPSVATHPSQLLARVLELPEELVTLDDMGAAVGVDLAVLEPTLRRRGDDAIANAVSVLTDTTTGSVNPTPSSNSAAID
ncbi:hypothetical protein [Knoellia subterranea]|nr:hypothetical protein [Knoellia subterranea]